MLLRKTSLMTSDNCPVVTLRCPGCGKIGIFEPFEGIKDATLRGNDDLEPEKNKSNIHAGQRRCPDPNCNTHIFFISHGGSKTFYPTELIEFDPSNIPNNVVKAFTEAISCHSHKNYIAGAIMVRKTLEELCHDQSATGDNLKQRIRELKPKVVLPPKLFEGLDNLRLLGNDAAHVDARVFSEIGQTELEVAIDFTKEVLKAVYQYESLLNRLQALSEPKPPSED